MATKGGLIVVRKPAEALNVFGLLTGRVKVREIPYKIQLGYGGAATVGFACRDANAVDVVGVVIFID